MSKKMGVAEVKRHFSAVISEVSLNKEDFIIEKKGKPMAAMVNIKDLEMIEGLRKGGEGKGLLAAIGAWEDFNNLEKMVANLYNKRSKSKEKNTGNLI